MNAKFEEKLAKLQELRMLRKVMEESGVADDPIAELDWQLANSPLGGGSTASEFQERLWSRAGSALLAKELFPQPVRIGADVPEEFAFVLAYEKASGNKIVIHRDKMTAHILVVGRTGIGKTTFLCLLIIQLARMGIRVVFHDHKGEGRRLMHVLPETMVFKPEQEFLNPLEPVGPPEMYWSALFAELGRAFNLHAETWLEGPAIMLRLARGMKPGQPFPSWRDLARILREQARKERRPKLATLAATVESLCAVLGRAAAVRRGPALANRYRVTVFEYQQLPPRVHRFLTATRLLRTQMGAMSRGHDHSLREVLVSDEAALEFGTEFSAVAGSGYVPIHKRICTQSRSFGVGILAGTQMLSPLDDCLKANAATFVCLCCPDPHEAREAQRLLMLPEEAIPQIMSLPPGTMFVRSAEFPRAVLATFPNLDLGPYIGDAELATRLAAEFAWLEKNSVFAPERATDVEPITYLETSGETPAADPARVPEAETGRRFFAEHRAMLREIAAHKDAAVTEHYSNLGWSAGRGNRVKQQLLEMGLVTCERQASTTGRPCEVLVLTSKGKETLDANC